MDNKTSLKTILSLVLILLINIVSYELLFKFEYFEITQYWREAEFYFNAILTLILLFTLWILSGKANKYYSIVFKKIFVTSTILFIVWFLISQVLIGFGRGNK